ncbi:hypothetical protein [Streptomyces spinosirectus]
MTTSPRWRSALASAATAAALVAAPLVTAGTAQAWENPPPTHPTHTAYPPSPYPPYPPKPPKPHHPGHGHHDGGHHENGHHPGHLANTGNDDKKKLALGGVAVGLIAAGAGTMVVARRRRSS